MCECLCKLHSFRAWFTFVAPGGKAIDLSGFCVNISLPARALSTQSFWTLKYSNVQPKATQLFFHIALRSYKLQNSLLKSLLNSNACLSRKTNF